MSNNTAAVEYSLDVKVAWHVNIMFSQQLCVASFSTSWEKYKTCTQDVFVEILSTISNDFVVLPSKANHNLLLYHV